TLDMVRTQEPAPPSRFRLKVSRDLETICLKAMAKDPERRYATAGELADDLRRFLHDEPIPARPAGRAEKLWRPVRPNPPGATRPVPPLTAAVLVPGAIAAGVLAPRPDPGPPTAPNPELETSSDDLLQVVAELDRTDPGWRLEQMEKKRPEVPADNNGALQI